VKESEVWFKNYCAFVHDGLLLAVLLADAGFSPHFLALLPVFKAAIKTPGWSACSFSFLTALSAYVKALPQLYPEVSRNSSRRSLRTSNWVNLPVVLQ
jgi:hypothetical protein